jgi:(1->4)-alpha-D-glucan 1-alpha-D-glucosylmutase
MAAASTNADEIPEFCRELLENFKNGRVKMWTTIKALTFRRNHPELFKRGSYLPLQASGSARDHVIAFEREHDGQRCVVVVPRFTYTLMRGQVTPPLGEAAWRDSELYLSHGNSQLTNVFTGEVLRSPNDGRLLCREVFAHFPVALLMTR